MTIRLNQVAILCLSTLFIAYADTAMACMAISKPDVRIIRTPDNEEHAVAFVSAYSCAAMREKSFCCIGIRFEPNAAMKRAKIRVNDMRFVNAASGQPMPGFNPTKKEATAKSFENEIDGYWYGFWAQFNKGTDVRGLSELRIEFTMAPKTTDDDVRDAFKDSHIGTSEGNSEGVVLKGEHHEILKTVGIKVYSEAKKSAEPKGEKPRDIDEDARGGQEPKKGSDPKVEKPRGVDGDAKRLD